jgi:hypothetical protein
MADPWVSERRERERRVEVKTLREVVRELWVAWEARRARVLATLEAE